MPGKPKKRDIRVTVTSTLDELQKHVAKLDQLRVQPDITWLELLYYHNVPVDSERHQIKSSRSTAFLDEQIQATALLFTRGFVRVQIVNLKSRVSRVAVTNTVLKNKRTGLTNTGRKEPQTSTPASTARNNASTTGRPSLTTSPIPTGTSGTRVTSPKRGGTAATSAKAVNTAARNASKTHAPVVQNGVGGQLRGELHLNTSRGAVGKERHIPVPIAVDPIIGGPVGFVLPHDYAESQASQDSQPEDTSVSEAKKSFLELFTKKSNQDFAIILQEYKALKAKGDDSLYRWQRKIPRLALVISNWDNHNP